MGLIIFFMDLYNYKWAYIRPIIKIPTKTLGQNYLFREGTTLPQTHKEEQKKWCQGQVSARSAWSSTRDTTCLVAWRRSSPRSSSTARRSSSCGARRFASPVDSCVRKWSTWGSSANVWTLSPRTVPFTSVLPPRSSGVLFAGSWNQSSSLLCRLNVWSLVNVLVCYRQNFVFLKWLEMCEMCLNLSIALVWFKCWIFSECFGLLQFKFWFLSD